MADFRRFIYALALVALFAGLTVPASAQMTCQQTSGVPPAVRAEGYAELMGDIRLDCTGGIPTNPGAAVPKVQIAVNLDVDVSSKITALVGAVGSQIEFLESLLIIDEPNSNSAAPNRNAAPRAIVNCGRTEAPDLTAAGPGICPIIGAGSAGAQFTYDGVAVVPPSTDTHPNVFQGRSAYLITGQRNQVIFQDIPIDPPGTICPTQISQPVCHRIIRITNIRGDASGKGVAQANQTSTITAELLVNPASALGLDNPTHVVARVQLGLISTPVGNQFGFVQCQLLLPQSQGLSFRFREGFSTAFKPRGLTQVLNNGVTGPYDYLNASAPDTSQVRTTGPFAGVTLNQNVPGSTYDTESGYYNGTAAGNAPGDPLTDGASNAGVAFSNVGGNAIDTGIASAGLATQGTRLRIVFSNIPAGSLVLAPEMIILTNVVGGNPTGVAVLVNGTLPSGSGGTPAAAPFSATPLVPTIPMGGAATLNTAIYEVYFSNPGALEEANVPLFVTNSVGSPNLPSNLPAPNQISQVRGGFAPSYDPALNIRQAAREPGTENTASTPAVLPVPRFQDLSQLTDFFGIVRCSCNLLFPFVTNAPTAGGNYDTGIAIANTSLDPGNLPPTVYGFRAQAQAGPVQLWYYNRNASPPNEPNFLGQLNTQCTNVTTPGSCTGTLSSVPAGGMLTYVLSSGGVIDGATPAGSVLLGAPGFTGYMIAQARFQYCHGFAFISKQGAGFQADNLAMGYVALVLDPATLQTRTFSSGEVLGH